MCNTYNLTYFNIRLKYKKIEKKRENAVDKGRLETMKLNRVEFSMLHAKQKKKEKCPPSDIDAPSRIFVRVVSS